MKPTWHALTATSATAEHGPWLLCVIRGQRGAWFATVRNTETGEEREAVCIKAPTRAQAQQRAERLLNR